MTQHTIAIEHVLRILQGVQRRGVDPQPALVRAGVSPALLQAPLARVSQAQFGDLLRCLRRLTRDDFLGMGGAPVALGTFDRACRLAAQEATLGAALRAGLRVYHGALPDFTARLRVEQGLAHMVIARRGAADATTAADEARGYGVREYGERTFLFFGMGMVNWLAARRIPVLAVDYATSVRSRDAPRLFHAPVRYGQRASGVWFDARWLDLPVVQTPQSLREFLARAPLDLLVRYQDDAPLAERIRRLLRCHLSGELPSLEQVGAQLAMTPQTLRRHLREEGHGFQAIKDALRRDAAIEYLARPGLSLGAVAQRLGFSEPSTFHRAFKKWTGVAPGEYRRTQIVRGGLAQRAADADTFRQSN